ncbi:hypothetical protein D9611_014349 [Ephemerocybe angulata]|uniref:ATP-citrate synthase citrate-binding domain-containing protein n=1 Tax=Ephemerocybe angulata TaxID=980116 RepID=A0A8H5F023_9AGAR|nr:hypothetical protein D9611_014349 [Tulosesus angulatus]
MITTTVDLELLSTPLHRRCQCRQNAHPAQAQARPVDEAAPRNQFHTADGRIAGLGERRRLDLGAAGEVHHLARETGGLAAEEGRQWEELRDEEKEEEAWHEVEDETLLTLASFVTAVRKAREPQTPCSLTVKKPSASNTGMPLVGDARSRERPVILSECRSDLKATPVRPSPTYAPCGPYVVVPSPTSGSVASSPWLSPRPPPSSTYAPRRRHHRVLGVVVISAMPGPACRHNTRIPSPNQQPHPAVVLFTKFDTPLGYVKASQSAIPTAIFELTLTKNWNPEQLLDRAIPATPRPLTVLDADGRIWTTVAEGGASCIYSDVITAHGFAHELDNYGEYSSAPTDGQMYECTKTVIDFTTRGTPNPEGNILVIGSANFMNATAGAKVYDSTPPIALFPAKE